MHENERMIYSLPFLQECMHPALSALLCMYSSLAASIDCACRALHGDTFGKKSIEIFG